MYYKYSIRSIVRPPNITQFLESTLSRKRWIGMPNVQGQRKSLGQNLWELISTPFQIEDGGYPVSHSALDIGF